MTETSISILKNGIRPSFKGGGNATTTTQKHIMCIDIKRYLKREYVDSEQIKELSSVLKRKVKSLDWFFEKVEYNLNVRIKSYNRIEKIHGMIMDNEYNKALVELFR